MAPPSTSPAPARPTPPAPSPRCAWPGTWRAKGPALELSSSPKYPAGVRGREAPGCDRMSAIDGLPPLREVISRHDLRAKKQLGQNFLLDLNLTARIARAAGDLTQCDVIEVGPGPGGLTRGLLAEGARHVLAIEKD